MIDFLWPIIGFMATGFAVSSTVPQIRKALRTKKVRGCINTVYNIFNYWSFTMGCFGIGKNDFVIIIGNSIAVALNTCMLILKIIYSRNPLDEES